MSVRRLKKLKKIHFRLQPVYRLRFTETKNRQNDTSKAILTVYVVAGTGPECLTTYDNRNDLKIVRNIQNQGFGRLQSTHP